MRKTNEVLSGPFWLGTVLAGALAALALTAGAPPPKPKPPSVATGLKLYYYSGCNGCHLPNKNASPGFKPSGGDLSHVGKRLTVAKLAAKITNPKATVPNSLMPSAATLKMSKTDVAHVAAYMASLK